MVNNIPHDGLNESGINFLNSPDLWFEKSRLDVFPSLIAHEYEQLRHMALKGQYFGSILQMKDMFEVLLKLPVLMLAALLLHNRNNNLNPDENKLLLLMLERRSLSLGDWEDIANSSNNNIIKNRLPFLKIIFLKIIELFKKEKITKWRNDSIGHGALSLLEKDTYKKDYLKKLKSLKNYLSSVEETYSQVIMTVDGKYSIFLKGSENARNLNWEDARVKVKIGENEEYSLYPFVHIYDRGIYIFDSHKYFKPTTFLLNYPDGIKFNKYIKELDGIAGINNKSIVNNENSGNAGEDALAKDETDMISRIQDIDDYIEPSYLKNWLDDTIQKNEKGIFLLKMDCGTGKSTFCRSIDPFTMRKHILRNTDVRVYYVNSAYSHKLQDFANHMFWSLISVPCADGSQKIAVKSSLPPITIMPGTKTEELKAGMINFLEKHISNKAIKNNVLTRKNLLIVIDGVDEIPAAEGLCIFDAIPDVNDLPENVYFLLTCRSDGEITRFTGDNLLKIKTTETKDFSRHSENNKEVAKKYIKNRILDKLIKLKIKVNGIEELMDKISEKAEHRLLYLRAVRELIHFGILRQDLSFDKTNELILNLPYGENLFPYFMDALKKMYGDKYIKRVLELIVCVHLAHEPLTVTELAFLMNQGSVDLRLLANLTDLRCFLRVERSWRGNLISLANEGLKNQINECYEDLILSVSGNYIKKTRELISEFNEDGIADDGETYLMSWFLEHLKTAKCNDSLLTEDAALKFLKMAGSLERENDSNYKLNRALKVAGTGIKILEYIEKCRGLSDNYILADAYFIQGSIYNKLIRYAEALENYDKCLKIMGGLLNNTSDNHILSLALVYRKKGETLFVMKLLNESVEAYDRCISTVNKLGTGYENIKNNELALTYIKRSAAFRRLRRNDEMLRDIDESIKIMKELETNKQLNYKIEYAKAYLEKAAALHRLHKFSEAREANKTSFKLRDKFDKEWKTEKPEEFAYANWGLSRVLVKLNLLKESLKKCDLSISIMEKLKVDEKPFDVKNLALAYGDRGNIFYIMGRFNESIIECDKAIKIMEKLRSDGELYYFWQLSSIYLNKSKAYCGLGDFNNALNNVDKCIETELESNEYKITGELSRAYVQKSKIMLNVKNDGEAIKWVEKALKEYILDFKFIFSRLKIFKKETINLFNEVRSKYSIIIEKDGEIKAAVEKCLSYIEKNMIEI